MSGTGGTASRPFAALIALVAWVGLGAQLLASYDLVGALAQSAWVMARYFTVITNLLVALVFTGLALGAERLARPPLLGGVTLAILLVGVVYWLLLRGLVELSGGAALADFLLHTITPAAALLFWIGFVPKGRLRWRHPLIWAAYPLAYFLYALVRGAAEGRYAYPFLDVAEIGWPGALVNGGLICLGFLFAGFALVWIDRRAGANG